MEDTKKVLLVTNAVSDLEVEQIKQALIDNETLEDKKILLSLVHVVPCLPTCYFNIPSMVQLAEQYYEEAKKYLTIIGDALDVPKKEQWLITGRLKSEVLRLAGKLKSDFILASSANIQDLQQALTLKSEHLSLLFRSFSTYSSL